MVPISNAVLAERINNLQTLVVNNDNNTKATVSSNHADNRKSIHDVRNDIQEVKDDLWKLKVKVALYAGGGSALVSGIVEVLKLVFHYK